ncbi:MAG: cytochrome c [Terracidiphilus sp.]|jgi:cytochrome c6
MTQRITAAAVLLLAASLAGPAFAQDAASLYKTKCQMCHGANGSPAPTGVRMGARSFQSPEVAKESDSMLFDITKNGKNKMPMYKSLTDDQVKDLVKYIRSLK